MNPEEGISDFMKGYLSERKTTLADLDAILKSKNIDYVVIGGMATIHYNYFRTTDGIDILVDKADKAKIKNIPIGFIHEHNVKLFFSGEISGDGINGLVFPKPFEIADTKDGIPYICLPKLIEFKLGSGIYGNRLQDFGDVQKLIRTNDLPRQYADEFRQDLKDKYLEIWLITQDEVVK